MTTQQIQYAYWQRMRQQQIYRAHVAGEAKKQQAEKVTLVVHKAYDSDPGSQAQIFINDIEKEFDVAYEFDKGTTIELKAFPPESYAVERFLYWSDDPEHATYSSTRQLTMNGNVELTAMFHANVS